MRKKDDEKQKNIKEAVIKLILQEGFHGTSISKIAKEAGVSPATVYIYYENKEDMLHEIYREYAEETFHFLKSELEGCIEGKQIIRILVDEYYNYIRMNEEIFHFVEQFSSCPALANQCSEVKGIFGLYKLFDEMKEKKIVKNYRNESILAIVLSPVKALHNNHCIVEEEKEAILKEMIEIIQKAILL
jgi:AcrR family transcriptional regulator